MAETKWVWEEFLSAERAQIGALEFFVCKTAHGAELYPDSGSFDQGYGSTSHASVEAAKDEAEGIARHTFDALSEHFAPVLRWEQAPGGWTARLGCWLLFARQNRWTIRQEIAPDWCRDVTASPSMTSGYRADEEQARRHAEAVLRSFGIVFRTEGE